MRGFLVLGLLLSASALLAQEDASSLKPVAPAEIARLIAQLDADKFEDREAASTALVKIGEPAKEPIQKAIEESESAEVRTRGTQILKQIRIQELQRNALKLDTVYQMARDVSAGTAKAEDLEPLLDRILEVIAAADPAAAKALPVKISNCKPNMPGDVGQAGVLHIGEPNLSTLQGSTAVFDAGGRISIAQNSIVIAWGVVDISSAQNCIVIAGADVSITSARNCLVLAGGAVSLTSTLNSTLGAGESLTTNSFSQRCALVNTKMPDGARVIERTAEVVEFDVAGLVLRDKPVMDELLADKLSPTFLSDQFMLFKVPGQPGEFVVRTGGELLDPFGKPLPGLEGWKTLLTTTRFATFANDKQRTFVRLKKQ